MIDVKRLYFIDILLVDFGILQYLFDGLPGLAEQVHVKLFEFSTSERLREVITIHLRPIRCFASKTVFFGLEWNAFLVLSPTLQTIIQCYFRFSGFSKLTAARHHP